MRFALRSLTRSLAGSLAALVLLAGTAGAQSQPVGFVAGTEGSAELQSAGGASWTAALVDQEVFIGDTVRTGPGGALKVVLVDDTTLSIGEDTELEIDSFVVGPAATQERSVLNLLKGQVRARVGEAFGGTTRLEMETPTAVIGVKGTVFEVILAQMLLTVCDWEGSVYVQAKGSQEQQDLGEGFCTQGWEDLSEPFPIPPDFQTVGSGPSGSAALDATTLSALVDTGMPVALGGDDPLRDALLLDARRDVIDQEEALALDLGNDRIQQALEPPAPPPAPQAPQDDPTPAPVGGGQPNPIDF